MLVLYLGETKLISFKNIIVRKTHVVHLYLDPH